MTPGPRRIPLLVPDMPQADALLPYLRRIDSARWYTNFGPLVREFEAALSLALDPDKPPGVVSASSCTSGLELSLLALGLPAGARVLLPSLTFVATATAVLRAGCIPVAADVDPESWLLTPAIAREAQRDIAAVMPVATFGAPQDADAWDRFGAETGTPVVIDAAGAFGNQAVGSRSIVVMSLHATKSLGIGEGGFVAARDQAFLDEVRRLSNFGIRLPSGIVGAAGTNAKLSEYHAALGLAALARWPERARIRRELAARYRSMLDRFKAQRQRRPDEGVYTIMTVCLPDGVDALAVMSSLEAANIESRRWYHPLIPDHPGLRRTEVAGDLACARSLSGRILGLPFHTAMTEEDIERVCAALSREL
ncbi:MAG: DegT/DnrJ/EryC1/StrS family aminotransferase [Betaproteobacteria bacterium]|nr:DegT/DnrJ/EryC1/StrS family aminotransferase [Betaproteobacteria bacterium]